MYLTFDVGTTALKSALIDRSGRSVAVHAQEYSFSAPRPDWAQAPVQTYWDAAVAGTRAVFGQSKSDPAKLAAIGFSSQGQTFVPVDRSGKPLYDAIVWVDNRAQEIAQDWEKTWLSREDYRLLSGYPWIPSVLTVFKLAWLRANAPDALRAWKILLLPDYLIYRLTGEVVTDPVTAQSTGMYDLSTGEWAPGLVEAAGISTEQLPRVVPSGTVAGRLRPEAASELGLVPGIPVCVGTNDQLAGAIGAGNVRPGIVTETTGTALALVATTSERLDDPRVTVGRHAVEGSWFVLSFATTSAIVLKWFRDICSPGEDYDSFLAGVESIPPGCDGITMIPHFAGTAMPTFNPAARGAFSGLALGHTRAHLARAIMEACACSLRELLEPVLDRGVGVESVRSLGGAARSDVWLQMKADLLGVPVERPACSDAASVGAAAIAAGGIGCYTSVAEASDAWYRRERVFEPNPSLFNAYREVYQRYLELYRKLHG
ncbi:MAG: xylulokinase [Armatimonadota bacterium]